MCESRTGFGCAAKSKLENFAMLNLISNEPNSKSQPLVSSVSTPLFKIEYSVRAFIQVNNPWDKNRQGSCIEFPILIVNQPNQAQMRSHIDIDPEFRMQGPPKELNLTLERDGVIAGFYDVVGASHYINDVQLM
jgi:hypothetical protein